MNELSITYYGNLRSYVEMLENVFFYKYVDYMKFFNRISIHLKYTYYVYLSKICICMIATYENL